MTDGICTDDEVAVLRAELEEARAVEAELHSAHMNAQERVISISRRLRFRYASANE